MLATNLKSSLDEAFLRRLDLSIDFAVPDPAERHKLWEMSLASVPRDDDVDLRYLSDQFELSGGYIRNIAMAASYFAAENSGPLLMRHLVAATAQEYRKLGRLILDREFGKYSELARAQA